MQKPSVRHFPHLHSCFFNYVLAEHLLVSALCFVIDACIWKKWLINGIFKPPTKHWLKPLPPATAFQLLHSVLPTLHVLSSTQPATSLRRNKLERKKPPHFSFPPHCLQYIYYWNNKYKVSIKHNCYVMLIKSFQYHLVQHF